MKFAGLLAALLLSFAFSTEAQSLRGLDKSPMDMAYYPDDFAHDRKFAPAKVGDKVYARVTYSRPAKNGREVFGKLIPYGKVWRVGANEATEIKFFTDATIQGKKIKAGVYSLYAIPTETEWTIILNSDLDQWGAYSYKPELDVLRVTASVKKTENVVENFTVQFKKAKDTPTESIMMLAWDNVQVDIPITF
ncbi:MULTISPECIES: DUF2911 domain-containing protein [unclassified Spirosoma]|uniref:DUF2911 domain-containing protein n=1 Tax=unclassified Spirosoma TaxID=2621999 RepID=UPI0009603D0C|nr:MULTISPECIES: DUF2911 domain-containing protein [unclassified Spirosoma]MBN8825624.1 DUF2911 domain-containing protein [Spirosoma sp.]OJW71673.1 MAG: hypothetical protein BGO59_27290 [Spirosoma sp. 48-14]